MVLVDSSSWIESLRETGNPDVRQRVANLLSAGEAAWCNMIRLELWNGARGQREKKTLREMDRYIDCLPIDDDVWETAIDLAQRAREAGLTVPAADLIISACAQRHGVLLEHNDQHLEQLQTLREEHE